jgi:putative intracellular protease/amidase/YHS domain-containing protein
MKRREFIGKSAMVAGLAAISGWASEKLLAEAAKAYQPPEDVVSPLQAPAKGSIPVAFVISTGAVMIDFAGPWEVFQDVMIRSRGNSMDDQMPFRLYTVGEKLAPITASGGIKITPDYTFANAPAPKVIVIPAQTGVTDAMLKWITSSSKAADVTMSVCDGAFVLAKTGLLSGKGATTHHNSYKTLAMQFPDIRVKPGARFVEEGNLATAGGLSSGIDLALHVVERYFGRKVATDTTSYMEYQGEGWMNPASNNVYAVAALSTDQHPLCPVCSMEVDLATTIKSVYKGNAYYFCSDSHKAMFDAAPEKWI